MSAGPVTTCTGAELILLPALRTELAELWDLVFWQGQGADLHRIVDFDEQSDATENLLSAKNEGQYAQDVRERCTLRLCVVAIRTALPQFVCRFSFSPETTLALFPRVACACQRP